MAATVIPLDADSVALDQENPRVTVAPVDAVGQPSPTAAAAAEVKSLESTPTNQDAAQHDNALAAAKLQELDEFGYWSAASVLADAQRNFTRALWNSLTNRYLLANCVYVWYAMQVLYINYTAYPAYTAASLDPDATPDRVAGALSWVNNLYIGAATIHVVNALMYIWSWHGMGYPLWNVVMIPEYLNVVESALYLVSANYYWNTGDLFSATTMMVHRLETAAATVALVAAFGWVVTWWGTYPRGTGRGFTFDDPDVAANVLIVVPSVIYLVYNAQLLVNPSGYGTNFLYQQGDLLFGIGSWFYLLAALRDDGWLWWMPLAGRLPYERVKADMPMPPPERKHE